MPTSLPPRPSLEWLRKTAKARLVQLRATDAHAKLADAQLAVAREHGFASWRQLKVHVEGLADRLDAPPPPEQVVASFLRHVGLGHIDEVRAALAAEPTLVNAIGPHPFWGGRPQPLHVAIETTRRDMFDLLLQHGADVSGTNDEYDEWSPLMLTINRDRTDMRDELLARGARIGLTEALMLGDDERVEVLLRSGILPDLYPNRGSLLAFARTPFAIDRLLELGASADEKHRWGSTAIDALSRLGPRGDALVRHLVARGVAASPQDYARLGDRAALAALIARDPSIAKQDAVMMGAVEFGHHDLVRWLLAHGANVNARAKAESRHTALHAAAWSGDVEMVRVLLEAGADPHVRDDQYDAPAIGWAETAISVTNNPRCADVVELLRTFDAGKA